MYHWNTQGNDAIHKQYYQKLSNNNNLPKEYFLFHHYYIHNTIDNCFYDPLFGERNIRWVRESTTYGELLTNYLRQILSDEEKTKKAAENVVNAGADDAIFALIGAMMFADSDSPDPPHVSFQNITRIFEGRSYSIPSASEVEEWEDGFDWNITTLSIS